MQTNNKLREAMLSIRADILKRRSENVWYITDSDILEKINSALAEPVRNCDVGTPAEQAQRMADFCKRHYKKAAPGRHICSACKFHNKDAEWECYFSWAQMPYEKGSGR